MTTQFQPGQAVRFVGTADDLRAEGITYGVDEIIDDPSGVVVRFGYGWTEVQFGATGDMPWLVPNNLLEAV